MPRNMSFMLTTDQIRRQSKTVTRRTGWRFLKPGDILNACEKCQGIKKGETINKLCQVRVTSVRQEPLHAIMNEGNPGCTKEGFDGMTPREFIDFFCHEMNVNPDTTVNRIEFEYI